MRNLFTILIFLAGNLYSGAQQTAPQAIYDPRVFNAEDYLNIYPDLMNAYGAGNSAGARDHWLKYGLANEGRRASLIFDPQYYLQNNPDLATALDRKSTRLNSS